MLVSTGKGNGLLKENIGIRQLLSAMNALSRPGHL